MSMTATVTVVGSINMDLTVSTKKIPEKGETILGEEFATYPGGKGANQAVAAARLGAKVNMIGSLGNDEFGSSLLTTLNDEGINTEGVTLVNDVATGIATILVSDNDNRIIVAPGANKKVSPVVVEKYKHLIIQSDIVLLQLEIPMETVIFTVKLCKEHQIPVIVNPAPYQSLSQELIENVSFLTPNELEVEEMQQDTLLDSLKDKLIITKGEKGVGYYQEDKEQFVPGFAVEVQDTTGAGDTFNGALAVQLGSGETIEEAIRFANASAALSVMKFGAQGGMPTRQQVMEFMQERKL
ncbi:ribokinase [Ornithinibacillus xuwenensis]|uniref:Ribokinase n=1 Tax=Ornithinibacillus xuwenensis TaxID=3144668 RepID=A0ABU9XHN8_9BACI